MNRAALVIPVHSPKFFNMKTISDFKRRVTVGTKMYTELYWADNDGTLNLVQINEDISVSIVQSNSFALKTWREKDQSFRDSWCEWPKKDQFSVIDTDTIQVDIKDRGMICTRLIYKFLGD